MSGMDCTECDAGDKRHNGCGVPPIGNIETDPSKPWREGEWTPDVYYQKCVDRGVGLFDDAIDERDLGYQWANFGGSPDFGFIWPCCPRFFCEKGSPAAVGEAMRIMRMLRAADDPLLAAQWSGVLTPREVDLYRLVKRFEARQVAEMRKRDAADKALFNRPKKQ